MTLKIAETTYLFDEFQRFLKILSPRLDSYAIQLPDKKGYKAIRKPLSNDVLLKHVRGLETVGCYLVHEQLTSSAVIDVDSEIDLRETLKIAVRIQKRFKVLGLPSSLEFSGRRGFHLWFFAERPIPASVWREALAYVLPPKLKPNAPRGKVSCEVFPKQDKVAPGSLGSLIKLPLGKHKWGTWSKFVDEKGRPKKFEFSYVNIDSVYGLGKKEVRKETSLSVEAEARISRRERVRLRIDMQELLKAEFGVDVPERRQFKCLFHKDTRPSAAIYHNLDGWLYVCFADGCRKKGRDVVDIIMESKGLNEREAISYLRKWWKKHDNNSG